VKKLDLSSNNITLHSNFFDGYKNVVTLIMTNAMILQICPGAFHSLKNLQTIDLSYNSFTNVPPDVFKKNPKLEKVLLKNNPLIMQPVNQTILISLSLLHLNLKNCKLEELSDVSLSQLPNMTSLDVSGNRFHTLPVDTLLSLLNLKDIDLTNNPWDCSNDFEKLVCLAYNKSNTQSRNITCSKKNKSEKPYNLQDQRELCKKLSVTRSLVTSITLTPKDLVDVTTDMAIRTTVNFFQNTSQEYTTTVPQEDTRKGSTESDEAFTISMTTQPPISYETEGPENPERGGWIHITLIVIYCLSGLAVAVAVVLVAKAVADFLIVKRKFRNPQEVTQGNTLLQTMNSTGDH
jgi:hypothetical protein